MKHGKISQIDAQVINNILKEGFGYNGGWVEIFGLKTPEGISRFLEQKYGLTVSAGKITEWLKS